MTSAPQSGSLVGYSSGDVAGAGHQPANLGDILERVLDRGIVIVGDIQVSLLDIELLTLKLRLVVASVDTARQMGIDWWESDPFLTSRPRKRIEADGAPREAIEAEESDQRRRRTLDSQRYRDEEPRYRDEEPRYREEKPRYRDEERRDDRDERRSYRDERRG